MSVNERQEMLLKEKLKFEPKGEVALTKADKIRGLENLIKCLREFEQLSETELNKIYDDGIKKIEQEYAEKK